VSIAVECAHCGKQLKVKDELAGKKGKCPQCQKVIQIPAAAAVAVGAGQGGAKTAVKPAAAAFHSDSAVDIADSSANIAVKPAVSPTPPSTQAKPARFSDEQYREQVLAAFNGQMTPPKVGIGRRLGAFIVLLIIALMPIFYFAVMGALAYGIWFLLTANQIPWPHPALQYVAIAAAALFLIGLIKPLIEPQRRGETVYSLDLPKEDTLREFTAKLCQQIDAPLPKTIQLECSTRMVAEKGGSVVTLGLPAIAAMSVDQFACVMANILSLHRPKAGCRVMNAMRGINYWLWRSVYGKGRFDRWLSRVAERRHFHLAKLLLPLMLMRLPAQIVLFIPMFIANTIAQAAVRAAEFDADKAASRLVGRKTFAAVIERLEQIDYSWDGVLADLKFLNSEGQLPDSLPQQVFLRMQDMSSELWSALRNTVNAPEEKPFDTKPVAPDRLEAVQNEPNDGVFRCPLAASRLFSDYEGVSRKMTADFYASRFGSKKTSAAR
jgi:phage FluMu protein Com